MRFKLNKDKVNGGTYLTRETECEYKQKNCECGMDEKGQWSDAVFDRFGCDCGEIKSLGESVQ